MPSAKLIAMTQGLNGENIGEILSHAFSRCYQKQANIDVIIKHLKHSSVLEHIQFMYTINCSRATWDQLHRHRISSPTAQSHRYTEIKEEDLHHYIPSQIKEMGEEAVKEWKEDLSSNYNVYKKWINKGAKKENARFQIAMITKINADFSINLRSLINLLTLRTDSHAQEEIQILAHCFWKELNPYMPVKLYENIQKTYFSNIVNIKEV